MKKILIVEDEKPMAKALELKLNKTGYSTKVVFDGASALRILDAEGFDLILLDLLIPEIDGFDVLTRLRVKGKKTPVIVLSNLSQEEDIRKTKELGALDFLVKSDITLADIVGKVTNVLQGQKSDSSG